MKLTDVSCCELLAKRLPMLLRHCVGAAIFIWTSSVAANNTVTLTVSSDFVRENSTASVTATLDEKVDADIEVALKFSGTATMNLDYEVESAVIAIPADSVSNSIEIIPILDWDTELNERVQISIDSVSGADNLVAGADVSIRLRDAELASIQKHPIGANLFLLAHFSYTDSSINVETTTFNLGAVQSPSTYLQARLARSLPTLQFTRPLFERTIPRLDINGQYRAEFTIDLDDLESGFHHLLILIDDSLLDLSERGGLYEVVEGFEITDDNTAIVRCRAPARNGTPGASDPLFPHQWTLINEPHPDVDESVAKAGNDLGMHEIVRAGEPTGQGVTVAVVDTGLEVCHPDLVDSIEPEKSFNVYAIEGASDQWRGAATHDPFLPTIHGDHGTSVAGVIAATADNGIGGRGVAPGVSLRGFNVLAGSSEDFYEAALGASDDAPSSSDVDIFNMSFGQLRSGHSNADERYLAIFKSGTENLRDGKGAVYVKAAGNSWGLCNSLHHELMDELGCMGANVDPTQNTPYLVVVGALSATGERTSYSSAGANLWVSAPAGEFNLNYSDPEFPIVDFPWSITTDQIGNSRGYGLIPLDDPLADLIPDGDYTSLFTGTSAAAPHVTGVVALMLERNPDLTWRDVKHVLANSARNTHPKVRPLKCAFGGSAAALRHGWTTNAAGYSFHNWYGFGAVDADDALAFVDTIVANQLGEFVVSEWFEHESPETVPDYLGSGLVQSQYVDVGDQAANIESVQLRIHMKHPFPAETTIQLISPAGTESIVNELLNNTVVGDTELDWVLLSNAFYGESPNGEWTVRVIDAGQGGEGTLDKWELRFFYGNHTATPE